MLKIPVALMLALALLAGPVGAQSESDMGYGGMQMKMQGGKEPSEANKGYMHGMMKMNESMSSMEMTGDATRDFVLMMIPHHQSAIDMAQVLLKSPTADPEIKAMAEKIISDQQKEIEQFNTWLENHKQ